MKKHALSYQNIIINWVIGYIWKYRKWRTKLAHDVLGTSPEGPLKVLISETYGEPSWDSQEANTKADDLKENLFLRSKCPKQECPRDVYRTQLRDVPWTKWWDVLGTSTGSQSNMLFLKFNSQTHQTSLTGYSRLYSEW